ncbi:MAG: 4-hydroxythreonine-4-phosphate dehydrogenase PdxA [Candidatus Omnitrophica bacterium]|nr:4-hydroxythreonine-4-phosphate dehydrogenase PdxA [Candidatus Omnitrophota bacterium]
MRTSHSSKTPVVITAGDPSGIGPEIILKSLSLRELAKKIIPLIIGDYSVFRRTAKIIKIDISPIRPCVSADCTKDAGVINFVDLKNIRLKGFRFGSSSKAYGKASMEYLASGISVASRLNGAGLVTAPINKASINKAGFKFAGHTEFLSHRTKSKNVTMMLRGGALLVSLVTRHIPINKVSKHLTKRKIIQTTENTHRALKSLFKIPQPKIGIAALNPHAGEEGFLGTEEKTVISPAVNFLKKRMKGIIGPLPADSLFYKAYHNEVDAVVCMYHDQGLIPLKMTAFDTGVNLTLGLPFIRTSPDHGTGFDIAGKGQANPSSMIEAIKLAAKLSKNK